MRAKPVGVIGIWPHETEGQTDHEVGWMVVPERQGERIATRALAMIRARALRWTVSGDSRLSRRLEQSLQRALRPRRIRLVGAQEVTYKGAPFMCNQWTLKL